MIEGCWNWGSYYFIAENTCFFKKKLDGEVLRPTVSLRLNSQ